MAQRSVQVPGIGPVVLAKRRGNKNLRLSVNGQGQVRVGMPLWLPYNAGVVFVKQRADWIKRQLQVNRPPVLRAGDYIGKLHSLRFRRTLEKNKLSSHVSATTIDIVSSQPFDSPAAQMFIRKACERALRRQAGHLLPQRTAELASSHGFRYKQVKIRSLSSRWGSYANNGTITLSYFLFQLPWPLIDYVIIHELVHTKYLNHSRQFWAEFTRALPEARCLQKQIRHYRPRVEPTRLVKDVT